MPAPRDPHTKVQPLEASVPTTRGRGRPPRIEMPALPKMEMNENEHALQAFFMAAYEQDYPDLTQTDKILLHLASLEYIKYLRVAAREFDTGEVITMSRQHPAVNMRALLDQIGATRKQRTSKQGHPTDPDDLEEARRAFLGMSQE